MVISYQECLQSHEFCMNSTLQRRISGDVYYTLGRKAHPHSTKDSEENPIYLLSQAEISQPFSIAAICLEWRICQLFNQIPRLHPVLSICCVHQNDDAASGCSNESSAACHLSGDLKAFLRILLCVPFNPFALCTEWGRCIANPKKSLLTVPYLLGCDPQCASMEW